MKRSRSARISDGLVVGVMTIAVGWSAAVGADVPTPARNLKVPDGFTIERVAGPPLVDRPITAAFDEQGRLYVADSSGSNDKVQKQLAEKPHRIVRLEDTDGDGRFDKRTVFADQMMFPEGAMWLDGSLYVAAPPQHLEADRHRRRRRGRPARGVVPGQDAHRLRQRPARPLPRPRRLDLLVQGGVRRADLRAARQASRSSPGPSHIFRCRPDGTGIEPVMTGGMDNPVDVVFTPGGERIFTTHVLPAPRRRPARRPDPRHLRRRLRQGPRRHRRPPADRPRPDAGADAPGPGRARAA